MSWHSIHVHYYAPRLDALILDAVRPFFGEVAGHVEAGYFVRHWRRGQHLRLNLRTDPGAFDAAVRPLAEARFEGYLAENPSVVVTDPGQLLPAHRRLANRERDNGPLLPWRPDNSLHIAPYESRVAVLGGEVAAALLAEFYTSANDLAFEMLAQIRRGAGRLQLAFDLMIAVAHACSRRGVAGGSLSFRSHAEGFLCTWPEAEGLRERWDQHFQAHAPQLRQRVEQVVAGLDGAGEPDRLVSRWVALMTHFRTRGQALIEAGELSMDPQEHIRTGTTTLAELTAASPYHRAAYANEWYLRHVNSTSWFASYRLALNYNYLQLSRIGLGAGERFLLCHLAANAVEQVYGFNGMDLVNAPPAQLQAGGGVR